MHPTHHRHPTNLALNKMSFVTRWHPAGKSSSTQIFGHLDRLSMSYVTDSQHSRMWSWKAPAETSSITDCYMPGSPISGEVQGQTGSPPGGVIARADGGYEYVLDYDRRSAPTRRRLSSTEHHHPHEGRQQRSAASPCGRPSYEARQKQMLSPSALDFARTKGTPYAVDLIGNDCWPVN